MREGPVSVLNLDRSSVAAWVAKVTWGFTFLETRLPSDRTKPDGPTILTLDQLELLRPLQIVAREWLSAPGGRRGSLHAFHTQYERGDDVDFLDDQPAGLVALRLGPTGIIASATDHQKAENAKREALAALGYLPVFSDLGELPLGPIQFRETFAWASTLHRSRPPFPEPGTPFGSFDEGLHRERLDATVGQLPAHRATGIPWHTTLFDTDMAPRYVSMNWTRQMGRLMTDEAND
jgi:hypothetical protein